MVHYTAFLDDSFDNFIAMFIVSAKIPEREGSISPSSLYGQLPDY